MYGGRRGRSGRDSEVERKGRRGGDDGPAARAACVLPQRLGEGRDLIAPAEKHQQVAPLPSRVRVVDALKQPQVGLGVERLGPGAG